MKCSAERLAVVAAFALAVLAGSPAQAQAGGLVPFTVVGDTIPAPLTGRRGDAARGRAIVTSRQTGLCLLCHSGPFPEVPLQGDLAPDLQGVGARLSEAQLRLRLVDPAVVDPATIMPSYYKTDGLTRVGSAWQGRPVLSAAQIEDVVAFLATLRE